MKIWPWSALNALDRALTCLARERDLLQRRVEWYAAQNKAFVQEYTIALRETRLQLSQEQAGKVELRRRIEVLEQAKKGT
jgi:hypothetical protein